MTDLEMTNLCREAIGMENPYHPGDTSMGRIQEWNEYDPLHEDAQAAALDGWLLERGTIKWYPDCFIFTPTGGTFHDATTFSHDMTKSENRRRARVECVAKIQGEHHV
jgi:hypothetical protein